jgi:predicted RNase H-like HicB family nuclease
MLIQWSDEDQAYPVTLPEWADRVAMPCTDGPTYEDAARNGEEVLRLLARSAKDVPAPRVYATVS